ncbi:non-canonical purine NTP pyrophosphatase [Nitrosomonas communis]|uniref:XTP/dITP diphosphohydrolase n=1 Tax=Nitrosomonas communis TaxID=44574 RepID=A0A1H2X2N4_9PROT|nr:non-canonical purine NTP pyrophosphatase [Nitrosomonas communis]SDW86529.1 XTP/dITP diphosphohydrolase [Nitrosomonas communis]
MEIRFLSSNVHKIREVEAILGPVGVQVVPAPIKIEEIQTEDVQRLVRDKVLKAFERIGRPVFVEHTGLHLPGLNGLPGGLTQIFWDRLQADSFVTLVKNSGSRLVTAKTVIGYCDSQNIHYFEGEVSGTVPDIPAGPRDFQWDCVFIPDGCSQTFAELGDKKNEISMRRRALDHFATYIQRGR